MKIDKEHILGIDLLKISTLFAIAILHANEFIFYQDEFPLGWESPVFSALLYFGRFFALGGQVLVGITYFLFGYTFKSKKALLLTALFALLGQTILAIIFRTLEWDIYLFIALSNALLLLPFLHKKNPLLIPLSFLMLWVPTLNFPVNIEGPWPMLPWFFLALGAYQTGLLAGEKKFISWRPFESILWPLLFLLSLPFLGNYYWAPIGPTFYDFVFLQSPWLFWTNFLPFIFILRISLLWSFQRRLMKSIFVRKMSSLYWNRHLGLIYLLSIIYLWAGIGFKDYFLKNPGIFDIYFLFLMPICELAGRGPIFMGQRYKSQKLEDL
jgi:hypothetical protein